MNFEELLEKRINITPKMEEKANKIYHEIAEFLSQKLEKFSPDIFPQGSFKLGTITRPISGEDEFDLDFVCLFNSLSITTTTQNELYKLLGETLQLKYTNKRLEPKKRCWRVNFDNFHIDILPAIRKEDSCSEEFQSLLIPDQKRKKWQQTNPLGYAKWFEEKKQLGKIEIAMASSIQPIPQQNNDLPLQKIIKLMKFHRDVAFANDIENKPISIIITTLAAMCYDGTQDLTDALFNIVNKINKIAPQIIDKQLLLNPVNPNENFADAWKEHPRRKKNFEIWVNKLNTLVNDYESIYYDNSKVAKLFWDHFYYADNITSQKQNITSLPISNPTPQWYNE